MSERDEAFARLQAAVAELSGMTTTDIRELFQREGVRGRRLAHCECPTAVFLSQRVGERVSVVGSNVVLVRDLTDHDNGERAELRPIPLPTDAEWFVRWFDSGQYTELEER